MEFVWLTLAALALGKASSSDLSPGPSRISGFSDQYRSQNTLGEYTFGYNEDHTSGGSFRRETSDHLGNKIGSYGLRVGDGRIRIVNYVADRNGFRAEVVSNEPGLESQSSNRHLKVTKKSIRKVLVPGFRYSSRAPHLTFEVDGESTASTSGRQSDNFSSEFVASEGNLPSNLDDDVGASFVGENTDTGNYGDVTSGPRQEAVVVESYQDGGLDQNSFTNIRGESTDNERHSVESASRYGYPLRVDIDRIPKQHQGNVNTLDGSSSGSTMDQNNVYPEDETMTNTDSGFFGRSEALDVDDFVHDDYEDPFESASQQRDEVRNESYDHGEHKDDARAIELSPVDAEESPEKQRI